MASTTYHLSVHGLVAALPRPRTERPEFESPQAQDAPFLPFSHPDSRVPPVSDRGVLLASTRTPSAPAWPRARVEVALCSHRVGEKKDP